MPKKLPLVATDLRLGAMYRAKKPVYIPTIHRVLPDDRVITWINPDCTVLQYDGPGVPSNINKPTVKVEEFLQWAAFEVGTEDEDE